MTNYVDVSIFLSEIEIEYIYELYEKYSSDDETSIEKKVTASLVNKILKFYDSKSDVLKKNISMVESELAYVQNKIREKPLNYTD